MRFFDELPSDFDFDIVLVSAGYDLMNDEYISSAHISFDALSKMVQKILDFSKDRPIAFLLEGGYNIESLVKSVDVTLKQMSISFPPLVDK